MSQSRHTRNYWQAAVRNWGSGVHRQYWPDSRKDSYRMRLEIYRAASRYM